MPLSILVLFCLRSVAQTSGQATFRRVTIPLLGPWLRVKEFDCSLRLGFILRDKSKGYVRLSDFLHIPFANDTDTKRVTWTRWSSRPLCSKINLLKSFCVAWKWRICTVWSQQSHATVHVKKKWRVVTTYLGKDGTTRVREGAKYGRGKRRKRRGIEDPIGNRREYKPLFESDGTKPV